MKDFDESKNFTDADLIPNPSNDNSDDNSRHSSKHSNLYNWIFTSAATLILVAGIWIALTYASDIYKAAHPSSPEPEALMQQEQVQNQKADNVSSDENNMLDGEKSGVLANDKKLDVNASDDKPITKEQTKKDDGAVISNDKEEVKLQEEKKISPAESPNKEPELKPNTESPSHADPEIPKE